VSQREAMLKPLGGVVVHLERLVETALKATKQITGRGTLASDSILAAKSSSVSATVDANVYDPFEDFLDRFNHDETWKDFPRWLDKYRKSTSGRFLAPEDSED
jgi:hypothetical protein